jgi:hypothetical protein
MLLIVDVNQESPEQDSDDEEEEGFHDCDLSVSTDSQNASEFRPLRALAALLRLTWQNRIA